MNDYSDLKTAAEACGPLPWRFIERGITSAGVRDDHGFIAFMDYSHPAKYGPCPDREAKARFIGHATPAVVLGLIADLNVSNNVGRALGETLGSVVESRDALVRVVEQLKAENEKLTNAYASAGEREHELRTELALLLKDVERFAYVVTEQAIVEQSKNGPRFWLVFPNGETQIGVFDSPSEAIDDMIERGNVK